MSRPTVQIAFLDVGQGDTIIVSVPETKEAVIVDCVNADAVITYLEKYKIQHLRGLIITHLHHDHYKDAVKLLNNIKDEMGISCESVFLQMPKVSKELEARIRNDSDRHSECWIQNHNAEKDSLIQLRRWLQNNRGRYFNLSKLPNNSLPIPNVFELVHPWEVDIPDLVGNLNDTSGVIKIRGTNCSALLTGDLEPRGWQYLLNNSQDLKCNVLKFPHHGAWNSGNCKEIIDVVDPSIVVISVGTIGLKYNHPNAHVFKELKTTKPNIKLLCTQATEQCSKAIEEQRTTVAQLFSKRANTNGVFYRPVQGCPCAGTVIIELSQSVKILQPDTNFHKEIIQNYKDHQCYISTDPI